MTECGKNKTAVILGEEQVNRILEETDYVRTGGSQEEYRCALYLQEKCAEMGLQAHLEPFEVGMAEMEEASLYADGKSIPCKGYLRSGNCDLEAEFYYLSNTDPFSLKQCRGKIVMIDGGLGYWMFRDLLDNGALGVITYDSSVMQENEDIDQKELRESILNEGHRLPAVSINAKAALQMIKSGVRKVRMILKQREYPGTSYNLVLDIKGETEEMIMLNAHYDSTFLSHGAYDNMSGSIGLLGIAEAFLEKKPKYSLRFIWCGSEERGLLGAKAYCRQHPEELEKMAVSISMDMIGCVMGKFTVFCTTEEKLTHYIQYMAGELGVGIEAKDGIRSTDATVFADHGVPSVSFARYAPGNVTAIHTRFDTKDVMSPSVLLRDIAFITKLTERLSCAVQCPVARTIPDKLKERMDVYFNRKREG